jgi:hypothetical protein
LHNPAHAVKLRKRRDERILRSAANPRLPGPKGHFSLSEQQRRIYGFEQALLPFRRAGGSPDIVAVIKGRFVWIEVKTPTGRQSDHQKAFQENLSKAGGIYFLVRSLDEAVEAVEDAIKRSRNRILDP